MMKYIILSLSLILTNAIAQTNHPDTGQESTARSSMNNADTDATSNSEPEGADKSARKFDNLPQPGTAAAQKQEEAKKFETGPYDKEGIYKVKIDREDSANPE